MISRLNQLLRIQNAESKHFWALGVLLFLNSVATQVSNVVAISGFLGESGINQLLVVLLIDMLVIIAVTSLQALVVDRYDRRSLLRWLSLAFVLLFLLLRLMFALGLPGWLNFSLLFLLSEQQWLFFPIIFWALAGDLFHSSQARRLFPTINSLNFMGKIVGLLIAAASAGFFARTGISSVEMTIFNALLYLLIYALAAIGLGKTRSQASDSGHRHQLGRLSETIMEGWAFIRDVPAFRYLTIAILLMSSSDIIIELRFLDVSDMALPDPAAYQAFYSSFRIAASVVAFIIASLLTSRLIERLSLKYTFLILPVVMFISALWMIISTGLNVAIVAYALMWVTKDTIDESARKAFQALVPDERRGRVSVFMDSYLLAAGTILGVFSTGLIILIAEMLASPSGFVAYLAYVAIVSLVSIWAVVRMAHVYDASMLNWRLKRRQRGGSIMDKLDF